MLVVRNTGILMQTAARFRRPDLGLRADPQGLGLTMATLRALGASGAALAKTEFSCTADPGLGERLADLAAAGHDCGLEAHVCLLQTALGFAGQPGLAPFVVAMRRSSRTGATAAGSTRIRARRRRDRDHRNGCYSSGSAVPPRPNSRNAARRSAGRAAQQFGGMQLLTSSGCAVGTAIRPPGGRDGGTPDRSCR